MPTPPTTGQVTPGPSVEQKVTITNPLQVEIFDPARQPLGRWLQRLDGAFRVFHIREDGERTAYLLHFVGVEAFGILCDRLDPVDPYTQRYDILVEKLKEYYAPEPLEIAEIYIFRKRVQHSDESAQEYMAALQKLSLHCKFGEYLQTELRNQFVFGLKNQRIQSRLLETANLTRESALKTACGMELAEKGVSKLKEESPVEAAVDFVGARAKQRKAKGDAEQNRRKVNRINHQGPKKEFQSGQCWQLMIKNVNVPATVRADETDYVILDCDYDLEDTPKKGLVVKWFFNNNEVAYQWIHGRDPLAGDITRKYVDLTYKASDDPDTEYRAMKLNKPGIDLTGEYSCVISTFADERSASASMVVYSTEDKFELVYGKKVIDDKDGVEITCIAEGLYPQPTLDISIEGVPEKQPARSTVTQRVAGLYDILSRKVLLDEDLPEAAIVKCLLGIPAANYSVSHQTVYYPGTSTTTATATTMLQHEMEIHEPDNSETGNGGGNLTSQLSTNIFPILMSLVLVNIFK